MKAITLQSARERILAWDKYLYGELFSRKDVVNHVGVNQTAATEVLNMMMDRSEVIRESDQKYRKPLKHWVHKVRLAREVRG